MTATIHQAKTHLSKLIQKALAGEEVIIANGNHPVVRLAPVQQEKSMRKRPLGWASVAGFSMSEDFNKPLDDFDHFDDSNLVNAAPPRHPARRRHKK